MEEKNNSTNKPLIALIVLGVVLILTWSVATFFEMALAKAFAAVVLALFGILVLLLMSGLGA